MITDINADDSLRYEDRSGQVRRLKGSQTATVGYQLMVFAVTDTPAQVAANVSAAETMTATGVLVGDIPLSLTPPSAQTASLSSGALLVTAADTITQVFGNHTAAGITPVAGVYTLVVARPV